MARIIPIVAVLLLLVGCDHKPGPVRDGIAKECPEVGLWIRTQVKNDPNNEDRGRDEAQGVTMQERLLFFAGHECSMIVGAPG